jgi:VanZ family protein
VRRTLLAICLFILAFGVSFSISIALTAVGPNPLPVWGLVIMVGALLGLVPTFQPPLFRLLLIALHGGGFAGFWLFTSEMLRRTHSIDLMKRIMLIGFFGTAVISGVFAAGIFIGDRKVRKPLGMLLVAFVLSWLVAFFSGDAGGADPMLAWFREALGLSPRAAEVAVLATRKTIHFLFYGLLALSFWKAAKLGNVDPKKAAGLAFVFALTHGVFDEYRQVFSQGRTGSPIDLAIDAAGAGLFLWLATRTRARRSRKEASA